jgi:hypothetical protein
MKRLALLVLAVLTVGLAAGAATANAPAGTVTKAGSTAAQVPGGKISVRFKINRFVKRGGKLYARGATIAKFTPNNGDPATVVSKPFIARVKLGKFAGASAKTICTVLDLTLGPLDLNLLGLMVHLDKVHLLITADSEGGLLGSLLCPGIAGQSASSLRPAQVHRLNQVVHRSGLARSGTGVAVPIQQAHTTQGICTILDLTLGPVDLNLLGLMVHLDTVHLVITGDPQGGLLGRLLCNLLGP